MEEKLFLLCIGIPEKAYKEQTDGELAEAWAHDDEWNGEIVELQDLRECLGRKIILMSSLTP